MITKYERDVRILICSSAVRNFLSFCSVFASKSSSLHPQSSLFPSLGARSSSLPERAELGRWAQLPVLGLPAASTHGDNAVWLSGAQLHPQQNDLCFASFLGMAFWDWIFFLCRSPSYSGWGLCIDLLQELSVSFSTSLLKPFSLPSVFKS